MKKHVSLILAVCMAFSFVIFPASAEENADVPMLISEGPEFVDMPDDYSTEALNYAVEKGFLQGSGDMIMPNKEITTAELATVMVRAANLTGMADLSMYTDIVMTEWYYEAMATALENGIIKGMDNMLYPGTPVTREAAFYALAMAFNIKAEDKSALDSFTDMDMITPEMAEQVAALVEAEVVLGNDNMIMPKDQLTRKDFAVIMHRVMMYDTMHTVKFVTLVTQSFTGEEIVTKEMVEVETGSAVAMPEEPANTVQLPSTLDVDKWYDLRAWYLEPELINRWDFTMPIEKNMTLYAEFVHIPDPPTNTHFSFINKMFVDSDGVTMVQGIEDGHAYGPIALKEGLEIENYMADPNGADAGVYLAYTIEDRMIANAQAVPAKMSGEVTAISAEGVMLGDGEMMMFDEQVYMYWAHADGTYSVYNKVAGRFPVEEMTEDHLPLGTFVSLFDARSGSDTFAEGKIDAIIVRQAPPVQP